MADQFEGALEGADADRRAFLKRLAIGTAFAAPVVSSFSMTGIQAAYAQTPAVSGPQVGSGGQTSTTSSSTTTTALTNQAPTTTTSTTLPNQTSTTSTTLPNQPVP